MSASSTTAASETLKYRVFISHSDEDKATIAIPLRGKLLSHRISTFVDETDLRVGDETPDATNSAIKAAEIAILVLSPEFVARKQTMKELMHFLRARKEKHDDKPSTPVVIPFYYRLSTSELLEEPRINRLDTDGQSLYLKTRFLERMSNGEPEANFEGIKAALKEVHDIRGVRNYVDAANDTSYVMSERRGILLDDICQDVVEVLRRRDVNRVTTTIGMSRREEPDAFCPYFEEIKHTAELVFDFEQRDENGERLTQEGRLLDLVLDDSTDVNRAVTIHGTGGVGKTSLVQRLLGLKEVKMRFRDGVYYTSLSMHAKQDDVIKSIIGFVEKSGGRRKAYALRNEKELREVVSCFRSWFAMKRCLFVVDDMWETEEQPEDMINVLLSLHEGGRNSKVVVTTCTRSKATLKGTYFCLEPLEPLGQQARTILVGYSGIPMITENDVQSKAVTKVLKRCCGLPRFLEHAGRDIRMISSQRGLEREDAYDLYVSSLDVDLQVFANLYQRQRATSTPSKSPDSGKNDTAIDLSLASTGAGRDTCAGITPTALTKPESERYKDIDISRKDPESQHGAVVIGLSLSERKTTATSEFSIEPLGESRQELEANQDMTTVKPSMQDEHISGATSAQQKVSVGQVREMRPNSRMGTGSLNDSTDDNIQAPRQSSEDEEAVVPSTLMDPASAQPPSCHPTPSIKIHSAPPNDLPPNPNVVCITSQTEAPDGDQSKTTLADEEDGNFHTTEQSLCDEETARLSGSAAGARAATAAVLSRDEDEHDCDTPGGTAIGGILQRLRECYEDMDLFSREKIGVSLDEHEGPVNREEEVFEDQEDKAEEEKVEEEEEQQSEGGILLYPATGAGATEFVAAVSSSDPEVKNNSETEADATRDSLEGLAPSMRLRAMLFETQAEKDDPERNSGVPQNLSYSLNGGQVGSVHQRSADIGKFEKSDTIQASQMMATRNLDSASSPGYGLSRTTSYSMTKSADYVSDGHRVRFRGFGFQHQALSTTELEQILSSYPENPMRYTSRASLYQFLVGIEGIPISSSEAFGVLQKGNGPAKVIIAMISQTKDHAIQEQGLHAFVRIMRATPGPTRETIITTSFGDCFRRVQNNPDAVVPKGNMGVDEDASGAVQAISLAMRTHAEIRRIQLSGCAALAEVASVSSPCRMLAYENGAVSLVLGCLRHRSTKAAATIHDVGSRTVSAFCVGKENFVFKEAFTNAGAVPELLSILRMWRHSENERSELTTTVVKSACVALRYITDSCAVASAQCVQSYAYYLLIRVMVLYREDVSVCTIVVSTLSTVTRNAGSFAEKGLLDAKRLREVLLTMQRHSDNPLFIRKSLDFMDALANVGPMKGELVDVGGIPFAAGIIAQNSNDSLLLERACSVVEKLCRGSQKHQDMFGASSGVQSLIALLKSQQGLPGVAERDLLAAASVCSNNPDNQHEAMKAGAPDALTRVLNAYSSKNAGVVAAAASAMTALVTPKNPPAAQHFSEMKAPDYVVRAMKKHPDSITVQENGSTAIAAFCESDPRIVSTLMKSGISSILVVALQRFLHKPSAVVQIARAMRAITNEENPEASYRFKTKLLTDRSNESSLPEIFPTALSYHKKGLPDSANVIISICATINRLCMRSVTFKNEVGKDGIVEELKRLVERTADYHEIGALQPVLATVCTLVLDSAQNKNRFHEVRGVKAVLDVMQKRRSDTYILEHCCAALRYSCNDHYGNCIEVKNHNGVHSVTSVMTRHSQNVNLMMWCCLYLADLCKGDEDMQLSTQIIEGIGQVISAMGTFADNHRFLAAACEFLRAVSLNTEENQERIVRLGGRTAIVKALESHPGNCTLTEAGSYALIQIQDVVATRVSMDNSGSLLHGVQRFGGGIRRSSSLASMGSSGSLLHGLRRFGRGMRRSNSANSRDRRKGRDLTGRNLFSFSGRKAARKAEEEQQSLHEIVAVETDQEDDEL